jgi:hypothetical protein
MPRSVKVSALLTFGLAILLFPFFDICKHAPALALVNAFAEDPYDAVGSFGIQLAPFLSLLAVLRAFRPYPSEQTPDRQRVLMVRARKPWCFMAARSSESQLLKQQAKNGVASKQARLGHTLAV